MFGAHNRPRREAAAEAARREGLRRREAATLIQSAVRGRQARKQAAGMREQRAVRRREAAEREQAEREQRAAAARREAAERAAANKRKKWWKRVGAGVLGLSAVAAGGAGAGLSRVPRGVPPMFTPTQHVQHPPRSVPHGPYLLPYLPSSSTTPIARRGGAPSTTPIARRGGAPIGPQTHDMWEFDLEKQRLLATVKSPAKAAKEAGGTRRT